MKQAFNPFLSLDVYIPDGEPHVFGDRVYLFGSHDKAQSDTYCALGYEIFSAPVNDLTETRKIKLEVRGKGILSVLTDNELQGNITVNGEEWHECSLSLKGKTHSVLSFRTEKGRIDILSFSLE